MRDQRRTGSIGYNAGENLVQRLGRIPNYKETKEYVRKVRSLYEGPTTARAVDGESAVPKPAAPIYRYKNANNRWVISTTPPPKGASSVATADD